ncbi:F-actin-capping protein subunit beta [Sorochytrium milnesiophthora]
MSDDLMDYALDLMRRLPPQHVEQNLVKVIDLAPELTEELLSAVDQPLKVATCKVSGNDYLLCDYNRDGDSYRSPWTNEYDPPLSDGTVPSANLRKLEEQANAAFNTYRELYFEGGTSSVYMWDLEDGFACVVLIKKVSSENKQSKGSWDSIHVFEVQDRGRSAHYKLTTSIMLFLVSASEEAGTVNLAGSLTRQIEQDCPVDDPFSHIANIGRMVEDHEFKLRDTIKNIYFDKTKTIVNDLRSINSLTEGKKQAVVQNELFKKLQARSQSSS